MEIRLLEGLRAVDSAKALLARQIDDVVRSRIGDDTVPEHRLCLEFLREAVAPRVGAEQATMIPHLWLGAHEGSTLAGAIHVSACLSPAAERIEALYRRQPDSSAPWILKFLNETASVEELAVRPEFRGHGVATDLLQNAHEQLRAHAHPKYPVASVITFATPAAASVFARAGYVVGAPRTPVPKQYQSGLLTMWDPDYSDRAGSHCYGHLQDLT